MLEVDCNNTSTIVVNSEIICFLIEEQQQTSIEHELKDTLTPLKTSTLKTFLSKNASLKTPINFEINERKIIAIPSKKEVRISESKLSKDVVPFIDILNGTITTITKNTIT